MSAHPMDWSAMRRGLTGATPEVRARAVELLAAARETRDVARAKVAEWQARKVKWAAFMADADANLATFGAAAAEAEDRHDRLAAILAETATSGVSV